MTEQLASKLAALVSGLPEFLISITAFLISISFHEFSHAYSAYLMGDSTAKNSKRMSLNPFRHFDLFAILFFIVFRFGWAKGVPIDPRNFKSPKKGMALSALAGPVTNILLAFISLLFLNLIYKIRFTSEIMLLVFTYMAMFLSYMVRVNSMLAIFNFIPIPPLDGSKIFFSFLPDRYYFRVLSYDRYMMIITLILVYIGSLDKLIINGVNNLIRVLEKFVGVFV